MRRFLVLLVSFSLTSSLWAQDQANEPDIGAVSFGIGQYEIHTAVEGQLYAIAQGDLSKAYYAYTSRKFRKATSLEEFTRFIHTYQDYWPHYTFDWNQYTTTAGLANIEGILYSPLQKKWLKVDYHLIQEENHWRILSIKLALMVSPQFTPAPSPEL